MNRNQQVEARLEQSPLWGPKTTRNDRYISGLLCPECGEPEAYTHRQNLRIITCNRKNKCGAVTEIDLLFPDLQQKVEEQFPPTEEDPRRPATAYLQARGLTKALEGLDYEYHGNVRGTGSGAVMFPVRTPDGDVGYNGRLFNPPPGEGKTHNVGKSAGAVWEHPHRTYDPEQETFLVEGIIDALSLWEMGYQAKAVLSSGADPGKLDWSRITNPVLCFDDDGAGRKALKRFSDFLKKRSEAGEKPKALMLPEGDWNDLLRRNHSADDAHAMIEAHRSHMEALADLARAGSAQEYADIWHGKFDRTGLFEYGGAYHFSSLRREGKVETIKAKKVSNFTLRTHHYQLDKVVKDRPVYKYHLEIREEGGRLEHITVEASELPTGHALRTMLLERARVYWDGDVAASIELVHRIIDKSAPVVRQLSTTGYDPSSRCYVYPDHMVDQAGALLRPNENGFFKVSSKEYVRPAPNTSAISPSSERNAKEFYLLATKAWGPRAAAAMAWMAASWFVNQIKERVGFFPFLSLWGQTQTGKSSLTRLLNAFQCLEGEGVPMNRGNTVKGQLRKLAQHSGNFVAFLEWPADGSRTSFDINSVLTIFNINPLQVRALKTNDIQTHETPFPGALMFVQNREPFLTKAQKERVVSLEFLESDLTPETREAARQLAGLPSADLASFFVQVMEHRQFFETQWPEAYRRAREELGRLTVTARLQETHGLLLGFHRLLCHVLGVNYGLESYFQRIVRRKQAQVEEVQASVADSFFEILFELGDLPEARELYEEKDSTLHLRLAALRKLMKEQNYDLRCSEKELQEALRALPAFLKGNHAVQFHGKTTKVWSFDLAKLLAAQPEEPEEPEELEVPELPEEPQEPEVPEVPQEPQASETPPVAQVAAGCNTGCINSIVI